MTRPDTTSKLTIMLKHVKNVNLLLNSDKTDISYWMKKQYTETLRLQFATKRMSCYFLYGQKSGCYIRQKLVF